MWLMASAAVVIGAVAVVIAAFGESRQLAGPPNRTGPVTPAQLRDPRIPLVWRGYDPGTVDALLARAARALEEAEQGGSLVAEGTLPRFLAATFNEDDDPAPSPGPWTARR